MALEALTKEEEAQLKQMESDDLASAAEQSQVERVEDAANAPLVTEPTETPEPKLVDKRALDEERSRRKKAEADRVELAQKHAAELARVQTRLELLTQAATEHVNLGTQRQAPAPEPLPDFSTDPAGFIQGSLKSMEAMMQAQADRVARIEAEAQQQRQRSQQQGQIGELTNWGIGQEAEFARNTPDYQDAMNHLAKAREGIVRAMGFTNPAEIKQNLIQDTQNLAALARQRGLQFGQLLYNLAGEHGYRPGAAPAASEGVQATLAAPQAAAPAANAAERILRGQDMATTIGSAGGAPRGEPAPQAIANMSDAEFEALYSKVKKNGGAAMRNLFGV